jgi:hypothetical protein
MDMKRGDWAIDSEREEPRSVVLPAGVSSEELAVSAEREFRESRKAEDE